MKGSQVTLKDIAKQLGITVATVSRALKDYPDISPQTKQTVLELAQKLHYRPNPIALNLRKNRSNMIGVIIPEIVHQFFSTIISGIVEAADEAGYSVMLCQTNESYEKEVREAGMLLSSRIDGLLISLSNETTQYQHLEEFLDLNVPLVMFDKICPQLETSRVIVDDFEGAFNAVEHLIQQGCQRIAIAKGRASNSVERFKGYCAALEKYDMPLCHELIFESTRLNLEEGFDFAEKIIAMDNRPDAILTVADWPAVGILTRLQERGIKIPEEVAVIGFNDWQMASILNPGLSMVSQPGFEMGKLAAQILLREIDLMNQNKTVIPTVQTLKTSLVIRQSSRKN